MCGDWGSVWGPSVERRVDGRARAADVPSKVLSIIVSYFALGRSTGGGFSYRFLAG